MTINPDAVGIGGEPIERSWDSKDCLLYALGVGAGADDPARELEFTTENSADVEQRALPTMPVVLAAFGGRERRPMSELGAVDYAQMVHSAQQIELHRPLATVGNGRTTATITAIHDKGKAALVEVTSTTVDAATETPLFTNTSQMFFRGEGGWGGDRGATDVSAMPDTPADEVVTYRTRPDQALLYRLNGDRNPLHSDPSYAARGGFDRPILHGLCTFGFTGRALLHRVCGSDPDRFAAMAVRFSSPVLPGESLDVHIWNIDDTKAVFKTMAGQRTVIDNGVLDHS
ncbi:MAG: MaoC/PaaZ C-terminal domain-containing protein [Acidimicrobiales bacterium]